MTAPGSRTPRWSRWRLKQFASMSGPNQLHVIPAHLPDRDAMLELHTGPRTEAGAREAIRVGVQYLAAWIGGRGAVPLYGLMEDAATAEICRMLLWQWRRFEAPLDDGRAFDDALFAALLDEEVAAMPAVAAPRRSGRPCSPAWSAPTSRPNSSRFPPNPCSTARWGDSARRRAPIARRR